MPVQPNLYTCNRCSDSDLTDSQVERYTIINAALDEPGLLYEDAYLCLEKCKPAFELAKVEFNFESVDESDILSEDD